MKYLFIDDHDIEAMDNLARKLHQPEKFAGNLHSGASPQSGTSSRSPSFRADWCAVTPMAM